MYLTRNDMTVEQAAINTCLSTDLQAVGDAVRLGKLGATAARALVLAGTFAFIITAAELLMASTTMAAFLFSWCYIALVGSGLCWLYERSPEYAGEAAIVLGQLIRRGADASLQAGSPSKTASPAAGTTTASMWTSTKKRTRSGRPTTWAPPRTPPFKEAADVTDPRF